jgi:hypothetical protein
VPTATVIAVMVAAAVLVLAYSMRRGGARATGVTAHVS